MDKYEIRRQKVEELIRVRCDGVYAKFADKIERSPSYVGRMLYPEGKPGKKNISDTLIDVIEKKFNLPRGWLDGIAESQTDTIKPSELKEATLTVEQERMLRVMERLGEERQAAIVELLEILIPERRKKNIGHEPERRWHLGPDIPPDPHDTRLYEHEWPDEIEQLQERKGK